MPLYTISRHLESGLPEEELQAVAGLVIGASVHYPSVRWQRSFQWDDGTHVQSLCVYEGPSEELVRAHSVRCSIPFSEIREVREYRPDPVPQLPDGWSLFLLTADRSSRVGPPGLRAEVTESTSPFGNEPSVLWIRTLWDRTEPHARRVVAATDEPSVRQALRSARIEYHVQAVGEALPSDWAEWFDAMGLPHHWELEDPVDAGPEPAYVS